MSGSTPPATALPDVTCPFCGLVCDDLRVAPGPTGLAVLANGCERARRGFAAASGDGTPRVGGRPASLDEAVAAAARLLGEARRPVIGGLGTDLAGARAAVRLADRVGGVLDHMNADAVTRNLLVLQDTGWITTTLSEVRNRCDLLVVAGGDVTSRFPRFFERTVAATETLFAAERPARSVIFLGRGPAADAALTMPVEVIGCDVARLGEAFGLLRSLLAGRPVQANAAAGAPIATWQALAEKMRAARYGVVTWAAPDFDAPHSELALQTLCELVKDLNAETRWSGLPLGGTEGDATVDAVATWQTGFGLRADFASGAPGQDLHRNGAARLLATGEADLLVWVASFDPERTPPAGSTPKVVLGHAAMVFATEPAVFIPVGTPGVDHPGHLFRTDRVVALPLAGVRAGSLPTAADALDAITTRLGEAG